MAGISVTDAFMAANVAWLGPMALVYCFKAIVITRRLSRRRAWLVLGKIRTRLKWGRPRLSNRRDHKPHSIPAPTARG